MRCESNSRWRRAFRTIGRRPIRLLVVLGLPAAVVTVFWIVIRLVGWGGYDGRGAAQFQAALFWTMVLSLALFWVSFRLWRGEKKSSPLYSPRALWLAIKQRPIRLLSMALFVIGSTVVVHVGGGCLLFLSMVVFEAVQSGFVYFDWAFQWSEDFFPILCVTPVVGVGGGLV